MGLEVVAVRQIDPGRGIGTREVDDVAIRRDDRGHVHLWDAACLVAQHVEDLARAHLLTELVDVGDVGVVHAVADALEDQVGGFHRLVGRSRQDRRHVGKIHLPLFDGGLMRAPEHQRCARHHDADCQDPSRQSRTTTPAQAPWEEGSRYGGLAHLFSSGCGVESILGARGAPAQPAL